MKKDVLISIKGLQFGGEDGTEDAVETLNRGSFYDKGEKKYVTFEETPDGETTLKSMVKFGEGTLELTRKGTYGTHLLFERGKKNYTDYNTPFGNLVVGMDTQVIDIEESENLIKIFIAYNMEINYEHVAECKLEIKIESLDLNSPRFY